MSARRTLSVVLILLLAYVLQTSIVAGLSWPIVGPDLFLLALFAWVLHLDRFYALLVAFGAGMLMDLAPPAGGAVGTWALILMVVTYVVSRLSTGADTPTLKLGLVSLASGGSIAAAHLTSLILGEEHVSTESALLTVIGVTVWNAVFAPWFLMLVRKIARGTLAVEVLR